MANATRLGGLLGPAFVVVACLAFPCSEPLAAQVPATPVDAACAAKVDAMRGEQAGVQAAAARSKAAFDSDPSPANKLALDQALLVQVDLSVRIAAAEDECAHPRAPTPQPARDSSWDFGPDSEAARHYACLDGTGLRAWWLRLSKAQRAIVDDGGELETMGLKWYAPLLARAANGDEYAQRPLADSWLQCQLRYGDMPAGMMHAAFVANDSDEPGSFRKANLFSAQLMGWGTKADADAAYERMARGSGKPLARFVRKHRLASRPPMLRKRAYVLSETILELLRWRLRSTPILWAGSDGAGARLSLKVGMCSMKTDLASAEGFAPGVRPALQAAVEAAVQTVPVESRACGSGAGEITLRLDVDILAADVDRLRA
jgi:hypothetical protein